MLQIDFIAKLLDMEYIELKNVETTDKSISIYFSAL